MTGLSTVFVSAKRCVGTNPLFLNSSFSSVMNRVVRTLSSLTRLLCTGILGVLLLGIALQSAMAQESEMRLTADVALIQVASEPDVFQRGPSNFSSPDAYMNKRGFGFGIGIEGTDVFDRSWMEIWVDLRYLQYGSDNEAINRVFDDCPQGTTCSFEDIQGSTTYRLVTGTFGFGFAPFQGEAVSPYVGVVGGPALRFMDEFGTIRGTVDGLNRNYNPLPSPEQGMYIGVKAGLETGIRFRVRSGTYVTTGAEYQITNISAESPSHLTIQVGLAQRLVAD